METERERIFREIYEDNIGRLYQYVLRRIGDVNYTEDTLQEVAVALLFHLNDFLRGYPNNTKRIQKWLFGVAENKIKHFWRKHYRIFESEVSTELIPELASERDEISDVELMLPDWLTEMDRKLIFMRCKGYNLKEIADMMGISHGACRMRSIRLTEQLKKYF